MGITDRGSKVIIANLKFRGVCPKCGKNATFLVEDCSPGNQSRIAEDFYRDRWAEFEYFYFLFLQNFQIACILLVQTLRRLLMREKNKNTNLKVFANGQGDLIEGGIQMLIDRPPLIPPHYSSGMLVTQPCDLYRQARLCFEMNAWDAVGMLCRKIIDIQTIEKWDGKNVNPMSISLFDRIKIIYKDRGRIALRMR
ncbi:hypothetical protein [Burkholderia glumae]|uniref:hypothetical protein n=1 Tax=Burkholderia glumae TaxID=337 RepID=UPI00215142AD|nr:hypothetical protein [Burkholderia glumae]